MRMNPPMADEELRTRAMDVLELQPREVPDTNAVTIRTYVSNAQDVVGEMARRLRIK